MAINAAATGTDTLVFEMHICRERRGFQVTFTGPEASKNAIAYFTRKGAERDAENPWGKYAWFLDESFQGEIDAELSNFLWPSCEHGLSLALCAGPGHYPADNEY